MKKVSLCLLLILTIALLLSPSAAQAETWTNSAEGGISETYHPLQIEVFSMASFGGYLYVGTCNAVGTGCAVFRTTDGSSWT